MSQSQMISSDAAGPLNCQICQGSAMYKNFGVYSCFSCKMFFKRNAEKQQKHVKCRFENCCSVSIRHRPMCPACRLKKCFANGMQVEFLRAARTATAITHRRKPPIYQPLNRRTDTSFSFDQGILLSKLVTCYDQSKLFLIVRRLINEEKMKRNSALEINAFVQEIYQVSSRYLCSNDDFYNLTMETRSCLLRNALENLTYLGWALICKQSNIFTYPSLYAKLEKTFSKRFLSVIADLIQFIDSDPVLMRLTLSLFVFSNQKSSAVVFQIEKTYAEVTWKYLLVRYNPYEAIRRFNKLIQCLLAATICISQVRDLQIPRNFIDYTIEQTELSLVLDDIDRLN